jgi:hypothetical protein
MDSIFKRLLLTLVAVPVGAFLGTVLAIPVVGAPHAFPGLLMNAPEQVRHDVGLALVFLTPAVLIYLIWHGPIWRTLSNRQK